MPLRTCSFTGPVADFCNLNIRNQACVGGDFNVSGIISGIDGLGYGNTLIVDQVDGNDAIGAVNGPRFKTIGAALAQAQPGNVVWVFPGIYNETVIVPPFVTLSGIAPGNVIIQQQNVTQPTDLVTLSQGANIADFSLVLTSQMHVQLRGLVFPASTIDPTIRSTAITIGIIVDNSGAGIGTSEVYGIHYSGPGVTIPRSNLGLGQTLVASSVLVNSVGLGRKRGVLLDSQNSINVLACVINTLGGTDSIGVELDDPNALAILDGAIINGTSNDISQTNGDLNLVATILGDSTANEFSFDTLLEPNVEIWGISDTFIGPGTFYLFPAGGLTSNAIPRVAAQKFLAFRMSLRAGVAPGIGESMTCTLQRNGIDTLVSLTLTDGQMDADLTNTSVHFSKDDEITMKLINSAGSLAGQVVVSVGTY